jgi:hypothetical protein
MQIFSNAGQDDAARIRDEASKFIPIDSVPSMLMCLISSLSFFHWILYEPQELREN